MIKKIATSAVYVDDQQVALQFWTEHVGFEEKTRLSMGPAGDWLEVGPKEAASCLVIYPKSMMEDWAERKPSIVFECDNIQSTYEEMSLRGVVFTQEPKAMGWGMFAIFEDLDGNWFGLREGGPNR